MSAAPSPPPAHDAYAALRVRDYRLYLIGSTAAWLGLQMQMTAVGWDIYERTGDALALGLVGLVQIVPGVALVLPAGHVADRFDRRAVLLWFEALLLASSLGLMLVSALRAEVWLMYACLFVIGVARAFMGPAKSAFMPQLVPREVFSNAVTWNSSAFQFTAIAGPALAGLLIGVFKSAAVVYALDALGISLFLVVLFLVRPRPVAREAEAVTLKSLAAGFSFVWRAKVILAAITLDMAAVLLGGAVALLPVFAKDILHVGPMGLGWLNAAPAVGALLMSLFIAHRPPMQRAGKALLWSVAGFGAATVVFGVSRAFWLSLLMLFLTGVFDMVSVVIRHTMVQLMTPDQMRGRVSAVNGIFIGLSNELGAFESGFVAHLFDRPGWPAFGPTISVVTGGLGTVLVVLAVAWAWPQLRRFGRLDLPSEPNPLVGVCGGCGYDLTFFGEHRACPECGHPFDISSEGKALSRPAPA